LLSLSLFHTPLLPCSSSPSLHDPLPLCGFLVNDIVLVLVHEIAIDWLAGYRLAAHAFCFLYCLDFLARISHQPLKKAKGMSGKPDRKSTRLNSSHVSISYAGFCLKKRKR